jgi:L-alanine-DL-glutamate epimerase-like enolase superfamily enzyme
MVRVLPAATLLAITVSVVALANTAPPAQPFQLDENGMLAIPEKPGLGIELNREALKKYGF